MAAPETEPKPEPKPDDAKPVATTGVGKFIQKYHTFLSTSVLGVAGLLATSIWQYRQSEIARRQSDSQQQIAKTQAENQWRIERAEILSKNLQILASRGTGTAEQRYGVLLSLTRGAILDPELAVSYALELGRDNPDYMKSVLSSTGEKDYVQLAHAFTLTCDQRFGVTRLVDACKTDDLGPRSDAIAETVADEAELWIAAPSEKVAPAGPVALLSEEKRVQKDVIRLTWLFSPSIIRLYQKKQWTELKRLEAVSPGAHLVGALVIAISRTGELARSDGNDDDEGRHAAERAWLSDYAMSRSCDEDCRGRLADLMLTGFAEAQGDFDALMRRLIQRPAAESGPTMERIHTRFVRCQVPDDAAAELRDRLLVPMVKELAEPKSPAPPALDNVVGLLALVPEPTEAPALAAWTEALGKLQKAAPERRKNLDERRLQVAAQQKAPPAALKKVSFCHAADVIDMAVETLSP